MTKSLEAARAYVAAHDALASPDHVSDVEKLRELSNRVREREAAAQQAQEALFGAHREEVESGEAEPADNTDAGRIIDPHGQFAQYLNGDHPTLSKSEFETANAHGAYTEPFEDFTRPARAD